MNLAQFAVVLGVVGAILCAITADWYACGWAFASALWAYNAHQERAR